MLAKQTAAVVGLGLAINQFSNGKATVELDPSKKDWLVMRVGNTRFDLISGGQKSALRMFWRVGKGMYDYSRFAKEKPGVFTETPPEVFMKYLSYKRSPGIQAAQELWTGKDIMDRDKSITPVQVGLKLVTPWGLRDIIEAWQDAGPIRAGEVGAVTFYGGSASTYSDRTKASSLSRPSRPNRPKRLSRPRRQ
jgi:hypothetical protein